LRTRGFSDVCDGPDYFTEGHVNKTVGPNGRHEDAYENVHSLGGRKGVDSKFSLLQNQEIKTRFTNNDVD
jgi:hypothetical protein